ncbi:hypothetical protein OH784_14955 [Ectobacillus funiculus]|uniref:hypothetical protein n=1 Tax=Ectobacillus funiculus TaxID=137993 RepID=UPI00397B5B7E
MLEKGVISVKQFEKLVFIFTVGSSVLYIPSVLAAKAKQDRKRLRNLLPSLNGDPLVGKER